MEEDREGEVMEDGWTGREGEMGAGQAGCGEGLGGLASDASIIDQLGGGLTCALVGNRRWR